MRKRGPGAGEGDYPVGYGKPPKDTRFKPGQSGNPAGRPKGKTTAGSVFERAMQERVTVTENGRRRSITKLEAVFKQMTNKAVTGDAKARQHVITLLQLYGGMNASADPSSVIDPLIDEQLFKGIFERYGRRDSDCSADQAPDGEGSTGAHQDTPKGEDHDADVC